MKLRGEERSKDRAKTKSSAQRQRQINEKTKETAVKTQPTTSGCASGMECTERERESEIAPLYIHHFLGDATEDEAYITC